MARLTLPIADGFYVSQSEPLASKRCVNLYPAIPETRAASQEVLFGSPGLTELVVADESVCRGAIVFSDGTPYFVIGSKFYSLSESMVLTEIGNISGTNSVSIASNGINIAIQVPGSDSYFYTPSANLFEVNTNADFLSFGPADTVTFKDGYYVYTTPDLFFSGSAKTVNDGKDFNALDFADAEVSPDKIVAGYNNHNQLYILGESTIEVFQTIATSGFPFQRIPGAVIQKGCASPNAIVDFDNKFLFIGGELNELPGVWAALGSNIAKVSTAAIDQAMQTEGKDAIRNATAFTYSLGGSFFAAFTVGRHTFVYDSLASRLSGQPRWHERQSGITNAVGYSPWRAQYAVVAYGMVIVGDRSSGTIGFINETTANEYGNRIERFFSTAPFTDQGESIFARHIELFGKMGLGNQVGSEPVIRMDYSDDGGKTWSNEVWRSLGKVGGYEARPRWSRIGRIPNTRIFRFKTTEPIIPDFYAMYANAEVTSSG